MRLIDVEKWLHFDLIFEILSFFELDFLGVTSKQEADYSHRANDMKHKVKHGPSYPDDHEASNPVAEDLAAHVKDPEEAKVEACSLLSGAERHVFALANPKVGGADATED